MRGGSKKAGFSTPEAREFFALAPVDQSAMLLEAASRAKAIAAEGVGVAILTGADTACVLAEARNCRADGPAAANAANVVFVPRLESRPRHDWTPKDVLKPCFIPSSRWWNAHGFLGDLGPTRRGCFLLTPDEVNRR